MKTIVEILGGRFGKWELKPTYRTVWKSTVVIILAIVLFRLLLFPFFDWLERILYTLNTMI